MRALSLLAFSFWATACGPVEYIGQVTRRASTAVEAAKEAGADRLAPYEYTSAVAYLHKANEEAGYAEFQVAIRMGKKAEEMARKAEQLAHQGKPAEPPPARVDTPPPPTGPKAPQPPKRDTYVPPEENE